MCGVAIQPVLIGNGQNLQATFALQSEKGEMRSYKNVTVLTILQGTYRVIPPEYSRSLLFFVLQRFNKVSLTSAPLLSIGFFDLKCLSSRTL